MLCWRLRVENSQRLFLPRFARELKQHSSHRIYSLYMCVGVGGAYREVKV